MALVTASELDHQAQVRVDEPLLGLEVAALDPLRELDLLLAREQGVAAGLVEEQLKAVRRLGHAAVVATALDLVDRRRLRRVLTTAARCFGALSCSASCTGHLSPSSWFEALVLYKV